MPTSCASHCPGAALCEPRLANSPAAKRPQIPAKACTETAPPGSSTPSHNSSHSTESATNAPATRPTSIAVAGRNSAVAALLATNPPTQPFALMEASGRPKRIRVITTATKADAAAQRVVLISTTTSPDGAVPPNRIAPAEFNPSQPTQVSRQPNTTFTRLCPGIPVGIPSEPYLPWRGPRIHTIDNAVRPPTT